MPVGFNLFDKVQVRSGNRWFEGRITDFIHDDETVFVIIDYVDTVFEQLAQFIINIAFINKYVRF